VWPFSLWSSTLAPPPTARVPPKGEHKYIPAAVLRIRIQDPIFGAFLPPGSGMEQWSDPDPGLANKIC
jgi:hypothetical protein